MHRVATDLLAGGAYDRFTTDALTPDEILRYVTKIPVDREP